MQNSSNYSNANRAPQRSPAVASIQNLQNYITQLTLYINQNNHKYNKNMHTLKQFYEAQIGQLQSERNQLAEEGAALRNQVVTARDIMAGKNLRIRQLEEEVRQARQEQEQARDRLMAQRKKIDQIYEEMAQVREHCNQLAERSSQKVISLEEEIRNLNAATKQKDLQIDALNQKVYRLEDQLSDRFSLPEKIKDIEKDNEKLKTALEINKRRLIQIQQKMDYTQAQIDKYRKENESLRIMKGKFNAQKSLQIQKTIKQEKQNAEHRIKRLQNQNQSLVYQLNQSEAHIKSMKKQMEKIQAELLKQTQTIKQYEQNIQSVNQNKDAYISQFGQLKNQYEGVIQRLQDSLIDYQKKNWNLQQQNKELNDQLQSLRQLLQEVRAINSLQPARRQYRKLAEMEVIASRPLPNQPEPSQPTIKQAKPSLQSDFSSDWEKLMQEIDKIKA